MPFIIAVLCASPWIVSRFRSLGASIVVLIVAVATGFFYVTLKIREPRWKLEMEKYVRT